MKKSLILLLILMFSGLVACEQKKFFVTFETNDGDDIDKQELEKIDYNSEVIPIRQNYDFVGWYFDEQLLQPFEIIVDIKEDIKLFAKWRLKEFGDQDLVDLYMRAYLNHQKAESFEVSASGEVKTSVTLAEVRQQIKSVKQRNKDVYYQLTASRSSFVNIMYELYGSKDNFEYSTGTVNSKLEIDKVNSSQMVTYSQYMDEYFIFIDELNYTVNHETVLEVSKYAFIEGKHHFELKLDLEKSVQNYIKNIQKTNQFESEPAQFESIVLRVEINEDEMFEQIIYNEKYIIKVKVPVIGWQTQTMNGTMIETFNYDENIEIIQNSKKGDN